MPNNIVTSFAKQSKKSVNDVEKLWDKSALIVKKEYPKVEVESDKFFKLVTGVLKNMLNINEESPAISLTDVPKVYSKGVVTMRDLDNATRKRKQQSESILERLDGYIKD